MALRGFGLVRVDAFYFKHITKKTKSTKICAGIEMKSVGTNIYIKFTERTNV